MKISIRVKPNARRNEVTPLSENKYLVSVTASPVEGKANEKVIEVLGEYFGKSKSRFVILSGAKRKEKIIDVS